MNSYLIITSRKQMILLSFYFQKLSIIKKTVSKSRGGLGISKGKYNMSEDFDEPLEDFKEYME
jgi:hypothetical protein